MGWCTALKKYFRLEDDPEKYGLFKACPICPTFEKGKISPAKLKGVLEKKNERDKI